MSPSHTRHARFNENPVDDVRNIPPSPASSTSSIEGSPGPSTPPPFLDSPTYSPQYTPHPRQQHLSPYASPPPVPQVYTPSPVYHAQMLTPQSASLSIPSPHAKSVFLHPVLETLVFNAAVQPSRENPPLAPDVLALPATEPPMRAMILTSPHLPWVLHVSPTSPAAKFVTVWDVLISMYMELRTRVKHLEYNALDAGIRAAVKMAFTQRVAADGQFAKGVKRVDFLCGRTTVVGLQRGAQEGTWVVHFR